jgi:hypothetical protein
VAAAKKAGHEREGKLAFGCIIEADKSSRLQVLNHEARDLVQKYEDRPQPEEQQTRENQPPHRLIMRP